MVDTDCSSLLIILLLILRIFNECVMKSEKEGAKPCSDIDFENGHNERRLENWKNELVKLKFILCLVLVGLMCSVLSWNVGLWLIMALRCSYEGSHLSTSLLTVSEALQWSDCGGSEWSFPVARDSVSTVCLGLAVVFYNDIKKRTCSLPYCFCLGRGFRNQICFIYADLMRMCNGWH